MTTLPTVDQVRELPASLTLVAPPEFEDQNGHVNVTRYYSLHMQAAEIALGGLGFDQQLIEDEKLTIFSAEHHLTFVHEVLVGQQVSVHVRLLSRSAKAMHGVSILVNDTTGRIANLLEFIELHVDLSTRRTTALRGKAADLLDRVIAEHAALDWDVPRSGPLGTR